MQTYQNIRLSTSEKMMNPFSPMNPFLPRRRDTEEESSKITGAIIGAAIEVHRALGPGLLEAAYEEALCHELGLRGLSFERQVRVPLLYKGASLPVAFVADLIVANMIVVELKAVEMSLAVHKRQVVTYLRLTGCRYGLLLNFGAERMVDGVTRIVDGQAGQAAGQANASV